jgi:hypothetical protein
MRGVSSVRRGHERSERGWRQEYSEEQLVFQQWWEALDAKMKEGAFLIYSDPM